MTCKGLRYERRLLRHAAEGQVSGAVLKLFLRIPASQVQLLPQLLICSSGR